MMRHTAQILCLFAISILSVQEDVLAEDLLPSDLTYEGTFRTPTDYRNGTTWNFKLGGIGYIPTGDNTAACTAENVPYDCCTGAGTGIATGYCVGTLIGSGHRQYKTGQVEEIGIPALKNTAGTYASFTEAPVVNVFTDVTGGLITADDNVSDVLYLAAQGSQTSPKLYWTTYEWYDPDAEDTGLGWSDVDFTNFNAKGTWTTPYHPGRNQACMFEIPAEWATAHLSSGGEPRIGIGRYRQQGGVSRGGTVYAIAPWNDGNPPANNTSLTTVEMFYPDDDNPQPTETWHSSENEFEDAAWIDIGDKEALVFGGRVGMRHWYLFDGLWPFETYRCEGTFSECEDYYFSNGYYHKPDVAALSFYSTADLAAIQSGTKTSDDVDAYAIMQIGWLPMLGSNPHILGVAWDNVNNRLFVLTTDESISSGGNFIHVFSVAVKSSFDSK